MSVYTDQIYNLPGFFLFNPLYNLNSKIPLISFQTRRAALISVMEYSTFKLKDGGIMPTIAIGTGTTFAFQNAFKVTEAIVDAVKKGYRHIDTAQIYQTEEHVGKAIYQLISEGVVQRQDLFITSNATQRLVN